MRLSGYTAETDPDTEKQFSALVVNMGGGTHFITFRGTDDTLVGWKENFNMSYMLEVPSQRSAADYLARAAKKYRGELILVGPFQSETISRYIAAAFRPQNTNRINGVCTMTGRVLCSPCSKATVRPHRGRVYICDLKINRMASLWNT
jgi:hypothetical protein